MALIGAGPMAAGGETASSRSAPSKTSSSLSLFFLAAEMALIFMKIMAHETMEKAMSRYRTLCSSGLDEVTALVTSSHIDVCMSNPRAPRLSHVPLMLLGLH